MKTFPKGVHPHGFKELSEDCVIREMPAPKTVSIPVSQHLGAPSEPVVAVGDLVKKGQLIAKSSAFISSNIFSSVSGKVTSIVDLHDANGGKCKHIVIENDGLETEERLPKLTNPTPEQIKQRLQEAGIVGLGGAGFPTHVKLSPPKGKVVDTFIINAAECEPYITCDYRIMLDYTENFLAGAELLAKALNVGKVYIGVETNKPKAITHLNEVISAKGWVERFEVVDLKPKYPQGAEKQLIYAVTKRKVPAGGLPADCGCVVQNVHTALSAYYAVYEGQTLYTRVLTVTGGAAKEPANLWVRTGTQFGEVIAYCGGEKEETPCVKLVNGGPMMGKAVANDKIFTTKTASCILMMSAKEAKSFEISQCINCAKCSKVCPMNLMPMFIERDALAADYEGAKKYGAMNCIECGSCSFVCPASRQLVSSIALAKKKIREMKI